MVIELKQRLYERYDLELDLTNKAKGSLIKKGYKPESGVRTLRRAIQDDIEDAIAERVLKSKLPTRGKLTVDAEKNELVFLEKKTPKKKRQAQAKTASVRK